MRMSSAETSRRRRRTCCRSTARNDRLMRRNPSMAARMKHLVQDASGVNPGCNPECLRLIDEGPDALAVLFSECRGRLERMVVFRLDARLRGRVEPSDVLQGAYLEIARRVGEYTAKPTVSFFVWVRQLTLQTL